MPRWDPRAALVPSESGHILCESSRPRHAKSCTQVDACLAGAFVERAAGGPYEEDLNARILALLGGCHPTVPQPGHRPTDGDGIGLVPDPWVMIADKCDGAPSIEPSFTSSGWSCWAIVHGAV